MISSGAFPFRKPGRETSLATTLTAFLWAALHKRLKSFDVELDDAGGFMMDGNAYVLRSEI